MKWGMGQTALLALVLALPAAAKAANTINYSGSASGKVYVTASYGTFQPRRGWSAFATTTISYPGTTTYGPFHTGTTTLNTSDTVTITAWMDVLGVGYYVAGIDPIGYTTTPVLTSNVCPEPDVTIKDPSLAQTPTLGGILPFPDGALVFYDKIVDANDNEIPSSYSIDAVTGAAAPVNVTVPAGNKQGIAIFKGLTPSSTYDFTINASVGGAIWPGGAPNSVTLPSPSSGGGTISGTIDVSGISISGTQKILAVAFGSGGPAIDAEDVIGGGSTSVSFTIHDLPDDDYGVYLLFDVDGDGYLTQADSFAGPFFVMVAGGSSPSQSWTMPVPAGSTLTAFATTDRSLMVDASNSPVSESWRTHANYHVEDPTYLDSAWVSYGPGFEGLLTPQDMTLSGNLDWSATGFWRDVAVSGTLSSLSPATFDLFYAHGGGSPTLDSQSLTLPVVDYVSSQSITMTSASNDITLSWGVPSSPPSGSFRYEVRLYDNTLSPFWFTYVEGATSYAYNDSMLICNQTYYAAFEVEAEDGSRSAVIKPFIPGAVSHEPAYCP